MIPSISRLSKTTFCSILAFLSFIAVSQHVFAQNAERPVARLVSSAGGVKYTRPRRVSASADIPKIPAAESGEKDPSLDEATSIERRAFDLTNEVRLRNGLTSLAWDPELCRMARVHSEKMAREGFFSHQTPEGRRLKDRAHAIGIEHFRVIAENIAYNQGYEDPGAFAVERWMISPGHRTNILYVGFQAAAVGVFVSADGAVYLTQAFITR
jgi:uncharacterized protein YkwD